MQETLAMSYLMKAVATRSRLPEKALHLEGYLQLINTLEKRLLDELVGQDNVVKQFCADLREKQYAYFASQRRYLDTLEPSSGPARPRFSALFLGPTGVGKTQTGNIVADTLFNGSIITLRGQDVGPNNAHGTSAWVGTSPGYVGHGRGGSLTNGLRSNKSSVILFDEIEKASPIAVQETVLGSIGDGKVSDMNTGETLDASQTVVIATSNIRLDDRKVGFGSESSTQGAKNLRSELARYFPPEVIGRFNGIYQFNPLRVSDKMKILKRLMETYEPGLNARLDSAAEVFITQRLGEIEGGARGVQDFFNSAIIPHLRASGDGMNVIISAKDGNLVASDK